MVASLLLLTLAPAPAAPVPKPLPPPVVVTAKRYIHPPRLVDVGGMPTPINVDDGNFIEVTIKNTSTEAIPVDTRHDFGDCMYVKVTDEKGAEASQSGYHLLYLCSTRSKIVELKPGDSAIVIAHLFQDWPSTAENRKPGKYSARMVFTAGTVRAQSAATFELEIVK